MKRRSSNSNSRAFFVGACGLLCGLALFAAAAGCVAEEPSAAATAAFDAYVSPVESRLAQQHRSRAGFLARVASESEPESQTAARLRRGELMLEQLTPAGGKELPGALLHDWRGTAFAPGAKAADFERLMRDFSAYPQHFAPQVVQAQVVEARALGRGRDPDHFQATMRVRQKHVITVVMDTAYDIAWGRLDAQHGYSASRSTRIAEVRNAEVRNAEARNAEIDAPGSLNEHARNGSEDHGFLWRLNTYWSYEERAGGLYLQVESVSMSRSIPRGLGWVVGPFVESVPRESLEFTLRATCEALKTKQQ